MQGGQVFTLFNGAFGAHQNFFRAKALQGFEPQALGLIEGFNIGEGAEILIVKIDAEQLKGLIDGINQIVTWSLSLSLLGLPVSRPSFCR